MKTTLAVALAFFLMLGTTYAQTTGGPRPGSTPAPPTTPAPPAPAPSPRPAPQPAPGGTTSPAPDVVKNPKDKKDNNGALHGKKKGWYKNPNNPHHPQTTNPGHTKRKKK